MDRWSVLDAAGPSGSPPHPSGCRTVISRRRPAPPGARRWPPECRPVGSRRPAPCPSCRRRGPRSPAGTTSPDRRPRSRRRSPAGVTATANATVPAPGAKSATTPGRPPSWSLTSVARFRRSPAGGAGRRGGRHQRDAADVDRALGQGRRRRRQRRGPQPGQFLLGHPQPLEQGLDPAGQFARLHLQRRRPAGRPGSARPRAGGTPRCRRRPPPGAARIRPRTRR